MFKYIGNGGGGAVIAVTAANGLTLTSGTLALSAAGASDAGAVTTGAQTFAGAKTFSSGPILTTGVLTSTVADGAAVKAFTLNSAALTTTAKILSIQNNGAEKVFVNSAGDVTVPSGAKLALDGVDGATTTRYIAYASSKIYLGGNTVSGGNLESSGSLTFKASAGASGASTTIARGVMSHSGTAASNTSTTESTLQSYTMGTSTNTVMGNLGHAVRITGWGRTTNSANAKTIKVYYGSQVILTSSIPISETVSFWIDAVVTKTGTNVQRYAAKLVHNGTTTPIDIETGGATQTEANALEIKITGQGGADNEIYIEGWTVEYH